MYNPNKLLKPHTIKNMERLQQIHMRCREVFCLDWLSTYCLISVYRQVPWSLQGQISFCLLSTEVPLPAEFGLTPQFIAFVSISHTSSNLNTKPMLKATSYRLTQNPERFECTLLEKKNNLTNVGVFTSHELCRRFKYLILHFAQMHNHQCHANLKCICFALW